MCNSFEINLLQFLEYCINFHIKKSTRKTPPNYRPIKLPLFSNKNFKTLLGANTVEFLLDKRRMFAYRAKSLWNSISGNLQQNCFWGSVWTFPRFWGCPKVGMQGRWNMLVFEDSSKGAQRFKEKLVNIKVELKRRKKG